MLSREFIVESKSILSEAKGHLDHPEDLVFLDDKQGMLRAIAAIEATVKNPRAVTIKWDGYPALIFGRGPDGNFTIMDKHMFNRADQSVRQLHSPQQWVQYEQSRGERARTGLIQIITQLWEPLERATPGKGYYWGDLLFSEPLQDQNGLYKFRANPNGIAYTVDVDSQLGKLMTGKQAGIAVHQYIPANAASTDQATSLNGSIGNLKNNSSVAIIPSSMPVAPRLQVNARLLDRARTTAQRYGDAVHKLMTLAPQSKTQFEQLFTTYINSKVVSGNLQNLVKDFYAYFQQRPMTERMRLKLTEYFKNNAGAVRAAFACWIAIYNLKMNIVAQLDRIAKTSPVKGYLQDGTQTQEGFVSQGLKFVNRMGFARQNLAARQQQQQLTEAQSGLSELVIYPGGFHPFHLGHASVFDHLAKSFPNGEVFVAATDTKTERPFGFDDKKFLANQSGVPKERFVQVKSPYRAEEITKNYDPNSTMLVFAVSEKDSDRFNFAPKKDGSPAYFQPYDENSSAPMSKHGYIYIVPKIDFKIAGRSIDSASKIRQMYTDGDEATRAQIIRDLYPLAKAPKKIKAILDRVLGGLTEGDVPPQGSLISPIPGTPSSLEPQPDPKRVKTDRKEQAKLRRFMGHR